MASPALPWVEKHRPREMNGIVGNASILGRLAELADRGSTPHLLLKGPPGCGKTATARCFARRLLRDVEGPSTLLQLNASDERCVSNLVPTLREFLDRSVVLPRHLHRLVLLDEADSLLPAAQDALRLLLDEHVATTRFILVCNGSTSIGEALQGKMAILKFEELSPADMVSQLALVCDKEGMETAPDGLREALDASEGDMRRALNIAQAVHAAGSALTRDAVHAIADVPSRVILRGALVAVECGDVRAALAAVLGLLDAGFAAFDVLQAFRRVIDEFMQLDTRHVVALTEIARTHACLLEGLNGRVQLAAMCARMCAAMLV